MPRVPMFSARNLSLMWGPRQRHLPASSREAPLPRGLPCPANSQTPQVSRPP